MITKSLPLLVVAAVVGMVGLFALINPVAAQSGPSRSLPSGSLAPDDIFTVTIDDIGLIDGFGQVIETLPNGFNYVDDSVTSSTLDAAVSDDDPTGQTVTFGIVGVDQLSYRVTVGSNVADGTYSFSGDLRKRTSTDRIIGDTAVTVMAAATATPVSTNTPVPTNTPVTSTTDLSRSLPTESVEPGNSFYVSINNVGLADGFGEIEETLPDGFSYVDDSVMSSTADAAINDDDPTGQTVTFTIVGVDSLMYRVTVGASVADGSYTFRGVLNKRSGTDTIGGDESVRVAASAPPVGGVSRSLPGGSLAAGDEFEVTISNVGLADGFGEIEETLPGGFTYVDDSVMSSTADAAVNDDNPTGQTVTFTVVGVDQLSYRVSVGSNVQDDLHTFSGVLRKRSGTETIGGDKSVRVGPEPTATPAPRPDPSDTPVPDDRTPRPTSTPRPTAIPSVPSTPVAIEKADVTAVEGATTVQPDSSTSVMSADGMTTLMLPSTSRARTYQVMVNTDAANCSGAAGSVQACVTVMSYDAEGNMESDVLLINRATVVIKLDASAVEDLGGLPVVFQANALGAFAVYQDGANDAWSSRRFSMAITEDGGVAVTVTGLRSLGSVALSVDEEVLQTAMYQVAGITPTAVPAPTVAPTAAPTAVPTPEPTAVPAETAPVGDATAPVGLLIVLALTGALMVYTGSRVMRARRSAAR